MKREKNIKTIITILILSATLIFTTYILIYSTQESEFAISEDTSQLIISGGIYNKVIDIDEFTSISMVEPKEVLRRTNGSALGNNLKGSFTIEGDLSVYLNLSDSSLDWLEIVNDDEYFYINLKNENDTATLYNELLNLQGN